MQGRVRGLLIEYDEYLSRETMPWYAELIDHNEYGIAFQMMLDDFLQRNQSLPTSLVEDFERVREAMFGENSRSSTAIEVAEQMRRVEVLRQQGE